MLSCSWIKIFKKPIGKPIFSDAVIFSFHPVKVMTTIEGGCLLTNSKKFLIYQAILEKME